jgi:hypothetical protein
MKSSRCVARAIVTGLICLVASRTRGDLSNEFAQVVLELRRIGVALTQYKLDHGTALPPRLTNLVSQGYLPADALISVADPSGGTEGDVPNSFYPGPFPVGQHLETDEPGSSFLYEFSEARCSWDWQFYLGSGYVTPAQVDRDTNGVVSWGEVKMFQLENGDVTQRPLPHPYTAAFFPVVRCFWCQYPKSVSLHSNGVDVTVLNLGHDLQTVFASPTLWELVQLGRSTSDPPDLRDMNAYSDGSGGTNAIRAAVDEPVEIPLWPRGADLRDLSYRLLVPAAEGQGQIYGRMIGNVFRWRPRAYSPSSAVVSVELSRGETIVTQKCYRIQVKGAGDLPALSLVPQVNSGSVVVEWNSITDVVYRVEATTNLLGRWTTNICPASGDGTRKRYTNRTDDIPARVLRLKAEFDDQ